MVPAVAVTSAIVTMKAAEAERAVGIILTAVPAGLAAVLPE